MNIKKRNLHLVVFLLITSILLVSAVVIETGSVKWETSDKIKVDGVNDLQQVIDSGLTYNSVLTTSVKSDPGHNTSEIWVSVNVDGNPQEMTLAQAISTQGICGGTTPTSPTINPNMLSTEIKLSDERSLQDVINNEEILYTSHHYSQCEDNDKRQWYDSCDNPEDIRESCPAANPECEGWSSWACSTRFMFFTIQTVKRTNPCYSIECTSGTDTCSNPPYTKTEEIDCGYTSNWLGGWTCTNADCQSKWTTTEDYFERREGCAVTGDTCRGNDKWNPYTCEGDDNTGVTGGCVDSDILTCQTVYENEWVGKYAQWRYRTVKCFA